MFSKPKAIQPAPAPLPPKRDDTEVQRLMTEQRDRFFNPQGGASSSLYFGDQADEGFSSSIVKLLGNKGYK